MKLRAPTAARAERKAAEGCRSPKASPRREFLTARQRHGVRQSSTASRILYRRRIGRRGFSLIELMVVVVLIGIMTAMILPAMKGTYEDALLRSTARKLVDGLTLANSRAVSMSQLHRLRFDRKNGRYVVERKAHDAQTGSGFVTVKDTPGGEGEIDSRISIKIWKLDDAPAAEGEAPLIPRDTVENPDRDTIAFYADGTAESAEIVLKDRENFTLALRINPTTARVRLVELERK